MSSTNLNAWQIIAMQCDNTSNNDTMLEELGKLHQECGYEFNALWACLCCMPHTVHLSALEVCDKRTHLLI